MSEVPATDRPPRALARSSVALAIAILLLGLVVRLVGLWEPPLDSSLGRQFHSAMIARVIALEFSGDASWRLDVARAGAPDLIELPLLEAITGSWGAVSGQDPLILPRIISIGAWLVGGVALYGIGVALGYRRGVLASLLAYIAVPFGVQFSRNFQPEPLMTCVMLWATWAIVRHDQAPSLRRLLVAAGLSSFALLIKPLAVFVLFGVFVALRLRRIGIRGLVRDGASIVFAAVALVPTLAYLAVGFVGLTFLAGQEDGRIEPQLLLTTDYWIDMPKLVGEVVTPLVIAGAIAGIALADPGRFRAMFAGVGVGYAAYLVVFTYHGATHGYYHLLLIPYACLAMAPAIERLMRLPGTIVVPAIAGGCLLAVIWSAQGIATARPPAAEQAIGMAQTIGSVTGHSDRVLTVTARPWPPRWMWYYGEFAGQAWTLRVAVEADRRQGGVRGPDAYLGRVRRYKPTHLVIVDRSQVDEVPGLWRLIRQRYRLVLETSDLTVFQVATAAP